jgi:hypothetical protein
MRGENQTVVASGSCTLLQTLALPLETSIEYGGPRSIVSNITAIRTASGDLLVNVDLSWFNKTSTRMAEAFFFSFQPQVRWRAKSELGAICTRNVLLVSRNTFYSVHVQKKGRLRGDDIPISVSSVLFTPPSKQVSNVSGWKMDVMSQPVDPMDVVENGTRHLHAGRCEGLARVRFADRPMST